MLVKTILILNILIFLYFMALCAGYTVLLVASFPDIVKRFESVKYGNLTRLANADFSVPFTVIMPAYNLSDQILDAVVSVLNSDYKNTNIIIVNDGSTDDTVEKLIDVFSLYKTPLVVQQKIKTAKLRGYYRSSLYPNLVLIDKEHSNTGDTLNAGINACRTPVFASVDADTVLEKDAALRVMFAFLSKAHCIVMGGAVYVLNDNRVVRGEFLEEPHLPYHFVPAVQVCEYFRSFLFGRAGWNTFGGALSYAGAFTLFETQAVLEVGGYDVDNFAQDAEIILRLHAHMRENNFPYSIEFTPGAFSWTEVPKTWFGFWRQRDHWQRGLLRSFLLHSYLMFNPLYGVIGMFSYPFYIFFEIFAPVIELTAYILLAVGLYYGIVDSPRLVIVFFALAMGYVGFLTVMTILLNLVTFNKYKRWDESLRILSLSLIEMVFFRQYHVLCKVVATIRYMIHRLMGKRL